MRHYMLSVILLSVLVVPFFGCATIVRGTDQKLDFRSDPDGAKVSVYDSYGQLVGGGKTPVTIPLQKGDGYFKSAKYRVVFEAEGYDKKEIWVSGSLNAGWYLGGNFLVGGLIGWLIVDPLTGAMWTLKPSQINANLDKSLAAESDGSLKVILADQVSPAILAKATPVKDKL